MNWKVLLKLVLITLIANSSSLFAAEPVLSWHTNMGSLGQDYAHAIAVDGSGNIYVVGWTESTWGTPIHPYAGGKDAFLAKLNPSGERLWHTFMGSPGWDEGISVAVDGDGNVYVTGISNASWGSSPIHAHTGVETTFAAKLDGNTGALQWHTFMGTVWGNRAGGIAVDTTGNVFVAGWGGVLWDDTPPINPSTNTDAWVAKLNSSGYMQWYTHMGSVEVDTVRSMAVDVDGNVFVAGRSDANWGSPVNPYAGGSDAFLAKLNNSGERLWHTFMGSSDSDFGMGVAVDGGGNAYFSGSSVATWGTPINPFVLVNGENGGFAAKLNPSGVRQWHTFLGSEGVVYGWGLAINESRNIFTGGTGGSVQLSPEGIIQGHFTIPHGGVGEYQPIAVDTSGNVYFGGGMDIHWWIEPVSTAIVPWTDGGGWDACVVKFETSIEIDIDIKPGSDTNSINLCSNGTVPIAILGSETFDVYSVNTETLRFSEASVKVVGKKDPRSLCSYDDVNQDIFHDLVCHFLTADIAGTDGQSSTATVNGELFNGTPFEGTDSITIVKDTCY